LTSRVHHCSVLSNLHISSRKGSLFVPFSFRGIFLTEARFSPEGRWFSRNSGYQDVTVHPQIRVVLGFVLFLLLFLCCIVSFGDHWRFFGRVLSIVVLVHLYRCSFYHCGARNIHRCNLPDHISSSLRSSYSFLRFIFADHLVALHSRRPSFCITKGVALLNTEEGRVNGYQGVRLMDSPTFLTSRSTCLDDLQVPVRIMTSTLVAVYFASCNIANHEHPRMAFISAASFSALHSSFRYLRSLYIIS
jgi:hypothetical protein